MAYEIKWHIEDRVIYIRMYDHVSTDDLDFVREEIIRWLDNSKHPIHLISDNTAVLSFPVAISALLKSATKKHPNLGISVQVNNGVLARYVVQLIYQVLGARVYMCDKVEEAFEILKKYDPSLKY